MLTAAHCTEYSAWTEGGRLTLEKQRAADALRGRPPVSRSFGVVKTLALGLSPGERDLAVAELDTAVDPGFVAPAVMDVRPLRPGSQVTVVGYGMDGSAPAGITRMRTYSYTGDETVTDFGDSGGGATTPSDVCYRPFEAGAQGWRVVRCQGSQLVRSTGGLLRFRPGPAAPASVSVTSSTPRFAVAWAATPTAPGARRFATAGWPAARRQRSILPAGSPWASPAWISRAWRCGCPDRFHQAKLSRTAWRLPDLLSAGGAWTAATAG
jgi:hypothetical protein